MPACLPQVRPSEEGLPSPSYPAQTGLLVEAFSWPSMARPGQEAESQLGRVLGSERWFSPAGGGSQGGGEGEE